MLDRPIPFDARLRAAMPVADAQNDSIEEILRTLAAILRDDALRDGMDAGAPAASVVVPFGVRQPA